RAARRGWCAADQGLITSRGGAAPRRSSAEAREARSRGGAARRRGSRGGEESRSRGGGGGRRGGRGRPENGERRSRAADGASAARRIRSTERNEWTSKSTWRN